MSVKKVGSISCAQELVWQLETKTIFDIKFVNTISFQSCINIYTHVWKMHDANAQASMDALHRHPALESLGKWSHAHKHTHHICSKQMRPRLLVHFVAFDVQNCVAHIAWTICICPNKTAICANSFFSSLQPFVGSTFNKNRNEYHQQQRQQKKKNLF